MMKIRILFSVGALVLAAVCSAQRGQSDVTVPSVVTFMSFTQLQLSDTSVDSGDVITTYNTEPTVVTAPRIISLFRVDEAGSTLLASMEPVLIPQQATDKKAYADSLNKAIKFINSDLAALHSKRIPLSQYNHLVTQHKRALKGSLALAKYLQTESSTTGAEVKNLTEIVTQLESLSSYITAVNQVLAKA